MDTSWYWRKLCSLRTTFNKDDVVAAGGEKFKTSRFYCSLLNQTLFPAAGAICHGLSMPKHTFQLWQATQDKLLTRDHLSKLNIPMSNLNCVVCDIDLESHSHLFFKCRLSLLVLYRIFQWLGMVGWSEDYDSWRVWLGYPKPTVVDRILVLMIAAVIYHLWWNRNTCLVSSFSNSVNCIVNKIKSEVKYRLLLIKDRKCSRKKKDLIHRLICNLVKWRWLLLLWK
ncbi:uncharacterized protein LOC133031459 [Cannabis sativa]|uniref:uncharacterized protein LOC133031459 n=1 Tax=Cannabis sativa TaxID=3483 RepID=UPI0029CA022C|nr:uncharacterized protein LOC133031459 [Cannabis sativa]